MAIAGVVLAAGSGTRFEGATHKLLAEVAGIPIVVKAVEAALSAGFDQLYVTSGAADLGRVLPEAVTLIEVPDWKLGQARSLACALGQAAVDGHAAVVVGLGDQPFVPASAWRTVGASRGKIVMASFDGQRRPPVKLESSVWDLMPVTGDFGARHLIEQRPDLVSTVACVGNPVDIDTTEDLERWS